jgi:hypothetical protein
MISPLRQHSGKLGKKQTILKYIHLVTTRTMHCSSFFLVFLLPCVGFSQEQHHSAFFDQLFNVARSDPITFQSLFENVHFLSAASKNEEAIKATYNDPCIWQTLDNVGSDIVSVKRPTDLGTCIELDDDSSSSKRAATTTATRPRVTFDKTSTPTLPKSKTREWLQKHYHNVYARFTTYARWSSQQPVRFRDYKYNEDDDEEDEEDDFPEDESNYHDDHDLPEDQLLDEDDLHGDDLHGEFNDQYHDEATLGVDTRDSKNGGKVKHTRDNKKWKVNFNKMNYSRIYDPKKDQVLQKIKVRQVSATPRVYVADNFVTDNEIDALTEIYENIQIERKKDDTGTSFELPIDFHDVPFTVSNRMAALVKMSNDMGGTLRTRLYQKGESHPPHVDWFVINKADGTESNLIATGTCK